MLFVLVSLSEESGGLAFRAHFCVGSIRNEYIIVEELRALILLLGGNILGQLVLVAPGHEVCK